MAPKVFVITGPSGVGKGTLITELCRRIPELALAISATTRAPRGKDVGGRDYYFIDRDEFDRRLAAGEFLESATFGGELYGTLRCEVDRRLGAGVSVVLEIEVQGARQVRAAMPDSVQIFISPPDAGELRRRLQRRGTEPVEAIEARLRTAELELNARHEFAHQVVNDELERAAAELETIVRGELAAARAG